MAAKEARTQTTLLHTRRRRKSAAEQQEADTASRGSHSKAINIYSIFSFVRPSLLLSNHSAQPPTQSIDQINQSINQSTMQVSQSQWLLRYAVHGFDEAKYRARRGEFLHIVQLVGFWFLCVSMSLRLLALKESNPSVIFRPPLMIRGSNSSVLPPHLLAFASLVQNEPNEPNAASGLLPVQHLSFPLTPLPTSMISNIVSVSSNFRLSLSPPVAPSLRRFS